MCLVMCARVSCVDPCGVCVSAPPGVFLQVYQYPNTETEDPYIAQSSGQTAVSHVGKHEQHASVSVSGSGHTLSSSPPTLSYPVGYRGTRLRWFRYLCVSTN